MKKQINLKSNITMLEHYQLMQKLCMWFGPICGGIVIICGLGWNYYGLKIKSLETVKAEIKKEQTQIPPKDIIKPTTVNTYNVKGDLIQGKKVDTILKKIDSNIKPEKATTIIIKDNANNGGTIVNTNTGTIINNEFVSGDKVINNKTVIVKQDKVKQRIVNKSDIDKILKTIPKDFIIELKYSFSNKECEKFGIDIANKLAGLNYKFSRSIYGQISTNTFDERLEIRLNVEIKTAEIIVHVLQ